MSSILNLGDTVLYKQSTDERPRNGTSIHPAMVTRIWNEENVNLMVMFDGGLAVSRTSVPLDHENQLEGIASFQPIGRQE